MNNLSNDRTDVIVKLIMMIMILLPCCASVRNEMTLMYHSMLLNEAKLRASERKKKGTP